LLLEVTDALRRQIIVEQVYVGESDITDKPAFLVRDREHQIYLIHPGADGKEIGIRSGSSGSELLWMCCRRSVTRRLSGNWGCKKHTDRKGKKSEGNGPGESHTTFLFRSRLEEI
jgi:hypothetical protein